MAQTEVTLSTAEFADAIGKAARVAPTKGDAFDKAAGIIIDFTLPMETPLVDVFSTNLEVTFRQVLHPISHTGPEVKWRVSSFILDGLLQTLPKGENDTVTLIGRGDDKIRIKSGSNLTAIQLLDVYTYPPIPPTPEFYGVEADEVASKLDQVAWATDSKTNTVLNGVMMDGQRMVGCNSYCLAVVPCSVKLEEQIVAPLSTLRTLLKGASNVTMESIDGKLFIALDSSTICSTSLNQGAYPNVDSIMRDSFEGTMTFHKGSFMDCMARLNAIARQERLPFVDMTLERSMFTRLVLDVDVKGVARTRDAIDVETDYDGEFEFTFQPAYLEKAIENARGDQIRLDFGHPGGPKWSSIRISDNSGYQCFVVPRRNNA